MKHLKAYILFYKLLFEQKNVVEISKHILNKIEFFKKEKARLDMEIVDEVAPLRCIFGLNAETILKRVDNDPSSSNIIDFAFNCLSENASIMSVSDLEIIKRGGFSVSDIIHILTRLKEFKTILGPIAYFDQLRRNCRGEQNLKDLEDAISEALEFLKARKFDFPVLWVRIPIVESKVRSDVVETPDAAPPAVPTSKPITTRFDKFVGIAQAQGSKVEEKVSVSSPKGAGSSSKTAGRAESGAGDTAGVASVAHPKSVGSITGEKYLPASSFKKS